MTLKQKFQNEIETESTASLNMGDVLSWGVLIFGEGQDRKPKFWPRQKWLQAYDRMVIARLLPGSSTVEHSAVNRRVASSNLARGAKLAVYPALHHALTATASNGAFSGFRPFRPITKIL